MYMTGALWRCPLRWPNCGRIQATPWRMRAGCSGVGLPEDAFTWHPVRKQVANSGYQLPDAIEPIQPLPLA